MKTVNRGWLLRKAKAGKLVCIGSFNRDGKGLTEQFNEAIPVRVAERVLNFNKAGFINIPDDHFFVPFGGKPYMENDIIHLTVGNNRSFNFKLID